VGYPWFLPALVEKARLLLALDDWEQAMETAQRILAQDAQNIEALRLTVLFLLARESRYGVAAQVRRSSPHVDPHMAGLRAARKEPKTHWTSGLALLGVGHRSYIAPAVSRARTAFWFTWG
jgi:hypothetical protein